MNLLSTLPLFGALAAKERAIQQVERGATTDERALCEAALNTVIARGADFTSEDVIAEMGEGYSTIREPRLLGAVIQQAQRAGRISAGDFVTGQRAERHGAPVRRWVVKW